MSDVERKEKKSKKEKKEKKEKREEEEAPAVVTEETAAVVSEEKKSKKDKKDKKRKAEDEAAVAEEEPVVKSQKTEEGEEKKSKKEKKDKKDKSDKGEKAATVSSDSGKKSSSSNGSSNRYKEHAVTAATSLSAVATAREGWNITLYPPEEADEESNKPIMQFDHLRPSVDEKCPYISNYITSKGFAQPSPIQAQCWPPLLSGRDVIGIAATGSGKTLAFLVPAMLKIAYLKASGALNNKQVTNQGGRRCPAPTVLVLAPTRELAMQSHQVVVEMNGPKGVCIYGGVNKQQQRQELQAGAEIVVATPGRLMDLLDEGALSLSNIVYMVLDEADRMLDEGFLPAIEKILSQCPAAGDRITDRQTVMFSATWPEEIRALADKFLRDNTLRVTVGSEELSANHRVTQIVECVQFFEKDRKLFGLLEKYHSSRKNKILIFVLYKKEAVELQSKLQAKGYNVTGIHGDKNQHDRTAALDEFKRGVTPLMIATDVAARGLDIPQVEYVINYSFPLTVEDYVHRIGRTGRGGATGISHTFFTDNDKGLAGALVGVLQEANQEVPQEIYKYPMVTKKKTSKLYGDFGPKTDLAGKKASKITFD